jgi:predicted ArsR family transcriptional regulator
MSKTIEFKPPKSGTKLERLVKALSKSGVTLKTLSKSLAWQEHTVRAAMTRLRRRGYDIERLSGERGRPAKYRIKVPA